MNSLIATRRTFASLASAVIATCATAVAAAQTPTWLDPKLHEAAKAEGALVVYSAINEEEALPLWRIFERESGVKVEYVRGNDAQLLARVLIEARAGRQTFDLIQTPGVHKLPPELLATIEPPELRHALPQARDPNRRWIGVTAIYQAPAYNSRLVDAADLPKTHEDLATRKQWAGRAAITDGDTEWLGALVAFYGEAKARALVTEMVANMKPAPIAGHLQLARAVAAGEYAVALSNYAHLTMNVKLAGGTTDFFALDPVGIFFNEAGVSARAPHPNAARLAANFMLGKEAQQQLTTRGRVPTRLDVETNPPGMTKPFANRTLVPVVLNSEQEKRMDTLFKELIGGRSR